MDNQIKLPLFVIAEDDPLIEYLRDLDELNTCGMEAIDVADELYFAYDADGQHVKLVTVNKRGEIERPTEDEFYIPFLGRFKSIVNDKEIKAIPLGTFDKNKIISLIKKDLPIYGYNVDGLDMNELIELYEDKRRRGIR